MTYDEAEAVLLTSKNPRMKVQHAEGIINPIVLADALGIRPQMVYNYIKKGKIQTLDLNAERPGVTENSTQHIVVEWSVAVRWVQMFMGKRAARQEKIEAQLRGEL